MVSRLSRRAFLAGGGAVVGGATVGLAGTALGAEPATAPALPEDATGRSTVPFHGTHQAGVRTPPQAAATLVAVDLAAGTTPADLTRLLRAWTQDAERLTAGVPALGDTEPELATVPAGLTVTVGLGPGAFDVTGLADRRPEWLAPLPAFGIDRLDERWSGGDVVVQVCADDAVTVAHAVRVLAKQARPFGTVRWVQHGFRNSAGSLPAGLTHRNLMGQVDGTVQPLDGVEDDLVWVGDDGPGWLRGGTGMVVRRIAMHLDAWDEQDRPARERVVGRRLSDGSPLTGTREEHPADLTAVGEDGLPVIDTAAHIRRAGPLHRRERMLRRPYNYAAPPPPGQLSDSGLLFIAFQADVAAQFVPIQQRLDELDLLNQWTTPVGSAVFAVLPGVAPGQYLGQTLLES
ncbi:Dyp-type peroxidase [uncultured Modestobacter sp.]|uniref:Dyp-type peroxidase n=1 Tax=uncultured Modestobacter sp. TaxID=380048 RepID=UPI0026378F6B|nr:Dyp-type peroxidase [uncultured Modestobacter sp.]